jgi:DNA polymerase-1|tara:strand:+ start:255 stop:1019 length:765 start_codon:yes stop_codon:yes gene_type:complete
MNLLIDADFIVYKCCAACETEIDYGEDVIFVTSNFSDAYNAVKKEVEKIKSAFGGFASPILFFSDSKNFRKKIYPEYKGHRNRKKPCGYKRVIRNLRIEYNVIIMPELEADDAMGIYATQHPGNVIVSPDKDMKQIAGKLYDLETSKDITAEEGAKWHLIQTLAGDQTDGYSGVPGIGVKRAETLFNKEGYSWSTVVKAFEDKGLTETDALTNARLARILTIDDYDTKRQEPKLWTPESTYEVNSGTGLQDESD